MSGCCDGTGWGAFGIPAPPNTNGAEACRSAPKRFLGPLVPVRVGVCVFLCVYFNAGVRISVSVRVSVPVFLFQCLRLYLRTGMCLRDFELCFLYGACLALYQDVGRHCMLMAEALLVLGAL